MLLRKLESIAAPSGAARRAVQELPFNVRVLSGEKDIACDGDSPSQCCLLVEGWTSRYKLIRKGRRQILSFDVPGDVPDLGGLHIPMMDYGFAPSGRHRGLHPASEPTRHGPKLHGCCRHPLAPHPFVSAVLREWIVGLGRRSACAHIAHHFCELYLWPEAVGLASQHRASLPMTQAMPGDALGLSPVHVICVLPEMRGMGLITLRGQMLVIRRRDELRDVARFDPVYLTWRCGQEG
jgi:hypothetical protein